MGFVRKEITVDTRMTFPTAHTVQCASIFKEGAVCTETAAGKASVQGWAEEEMKLKYIILVALYI